MVIKTGPILNKLLNIWKVTPTLISIPLLYVMEYLIQTGIPKKVSISSHHVHPIMKVNSKMSQNQNEFDLFGHVIPILTHAFYKLKNV